MKPTIIQIAPMLPIVEAALNEAYSVLRLWEAEDRDAALRAVAKEARGVATDGHWGCPPDVWDACQALEIIASYGVGYDNIDTSACRARGVKVTNTPDVLNDAMAEITLGLMIALCRRIPQADQFIREGRWAAGNFALTGELTGKTVGILGLGRIGKEIARRCQAFKMQVVYHGRHEQADTPYPYYADLKTMAQDVDWLVSVLPGSPQTVGIISREIMEALGPEGMLVNVGRGTAVDETALVELLQSGALGGAALDVFENEPSVPAALMTMDNVVLSPHQGSATEKTRDGMGNLVVRNLAAFFAGDPLITPVV